MRKKLLAVILSVVMIGIMVPAAAFGADIIASGECGADGSNVTWTLDSDGILTISGTGEMDNFHNYRPTWVSNLESIKTVVIKNGITSIGDAAFWGAENMTSIEIPDSMTRIGDIAFKTCFGLTSVTIPKSVTSIEQAFYYCSGLTEVNVDPENPVYTSIDGVLINRDKAELVYYPEGKTDKNYTVPDSVKSIGEYAFFKSLLKSVKIPEGVTSIGKGAFAMSFDLESVEIPLSVKSIGDIAFSQCESLKDVYYRGTQDQWADISIGESNDPIKDPANIRYESSMEPDEIPYDLWVNGEQITSANAANIPVGSGTAVFKPDTNTLTLTNANITKGYKYVGENYEEMIGIYSKDIDLTVVLEGKNTVKGNDLDDGIVAGDGTLAIKAEDGGSLLVDVKDDCLATPEKVTIESGDITLKGFYGIITAGTIEIKDGKVEVIAGDAGLDGHAGVNISGGEVNLSCNGGFAIYSNEAINLSGSDTIIEASGVTNAIFAVKNINIEEPLAITDPEDGRLGSNSNGKFIVYPNNAYVTRVVIAKPYTITVDENITNGAVTTEPVEKAAKGMEVSVTAEPDSGYKLDKITVTDSEGNEIPVKGGKFTMPADNVTVSAMFKKSGGGGGGGSGIVSFILTYETNGGEKIKAESHKVGDEVTLDKTPVKDGYTFTGWYADKECTQKIESITMNSSKTVYAGWDDGEEPVNPDAPLMTIKIGSTKYQLNGVDMEMDVAPFIDENDRTMLPVRVVANALGISDEDIAWDNETKTASFTRPDGKVVSCTVGEKAVKIGDDIVEIDTAPVIANDRIFLPMRALFNAFNVSDDHIIWDGAEKTVTVTKEAIEDIKSI